MKNILKILIIITILSSCQKEPEMIIAISKGAGSPHYENYSKWVESIYPNAKCINLYTLSADSVNKVMEICDGLILSGGPDVHPGRFDKVADTAICSMDLKRDTLEWAICKIAFRKKIPILAICRGMQLLNVYKGGTLITDIPTYNNSLIHRDTNNPQLKHNIKVANLSDLWEITNKEVGTVNSAHHQAVGKIASCFKPTAFADDGIIEAYEFINPVNKPYLIAVQWHPERLGKENPFADKLGKKFIDEVIKAKD